MKEVKKYARTDEVHRLSGNERRIEEIQELTLCSRTLCETSEKSVVHRGEGHFFGSMLTHLTWRSPTLKLSITATRLPITNTSLLTTYYALIVCEAVRRVCPCDDDRDAKEGDCVHLIRP